MDDDGYLNIVGRIKDMIIRGGENVYPREIEEFLYTHPDIVDVQVIGVPDVKYGEEIMAWVRLRDGRRRSTPRTSREFCQGQHRPLQGAALRARHRRVPDDRHRQGPEVQDARGGHRAARPAGRRQRPDRLAAAPTRSVTDQGVSGQAVRSQASAAWAVGAQAVGGDGAEAAGLEVLDGLHQLGPGVHHERAVGGDGLADRAGRRAGARRAARAGRRPSSVSASPAPNTASWPASTGPALGADGARAGEHVGEGVEVGRARAAPGGRRARAWRGRR